MGDLPKVNQKSTNEEFFIGQLHICAHAQNLINSIIAPLNEEDYVIFYPKDEKGKEKEFDIDLAREVIAQGYLASVRKRFIILSAPKFRLEAQNALLKILEEPPKNVQFVMIVPSKNAILPTIISRLQCTNHKDAQPLPLFPLNLARLNLESVYEFLTQCDKANRTPHEVKAHIQSLLIAAHTYKIPLTQAHLQDYDRAIKQADSLIIKESAIFLPLLLKILQINKGKK